jgi:hypothetical protein
MYLPIYPCMQVDPTEEEEEEEEMIDWLIELQQLTVREQEGN